MPIDPLAPLPLAPLGSAPESKDSSGAFPHKGLMDHIIKGLFGNDMADLTPEDAAIKKKALASGQAEAGKDAAQFANDPAGAAASYMKAPNPGGDGGSPFDFVKSIAKLFAKSGGLGT